MAMYRKLGALVVTLAGITLSAASPALAQDAAEQGAARDQGATDQGTATDQDAATEDTKAADTGAGERGAAGEAGETGMGEAGEAGMGEAGEAGMGEAGEADLGEAGEAGEAGEETVGAAEAGEAATEEGTSEAPLIVQLPQHLIADTSLFIANASNTARVLHSQQALHVSSPQINSQAGFLVMSIDRSLASLQDLNQNALATHPDAVPAIRSTIAQLVAARAQARQALEVVRSGELGPTFSVAIRAANEHLRSAAIHLRTVSYRYGHHGLVLPVGGMLPAGGVLAPSGAQQYGK